MDSLSDILKIPKDLGFVVLIIVQESLKLNAKFIENGETRGSKEQHDVCIKEVRIEAPIPLTF